MGAEVNNVNMIGDSGETRAGERGVSPFEKRDILSGQGTCDLGHSPRVVLWPSGIGLFQKRGLTQLDISLLDPTTECI